MYRYTKSNNYISNEQRDFYEQNGYFVIRNLVNHDVLDECRQRFVDFCNGTVKGYITNVMKDLELVFRGAKGEHAVNKLQDFLYDDIFFKYVNYSPMIDIVESIIGPNITASHSMIINKPPDMDPDLSLHPLHQDLYYFPFRPADSIVGVWTAMEHVDDQNGCLYVLPGSHKRDQLYVHHYIQSSKNKVLYHGVEGFRDEPRINLNMEKGDTVLFHPLLLHGSGPNLTKGFRKAISCHYADSFCHFIDVRGTVQEKMAEEVTNIVNKKYKTTMSFNDVWKIKSRYLRGIPGPYQHLDSKL